ncbi:diadenylate cyclase [Synechococcus sp. BO 8801]|uniref:diadenylate cyclase n=1 Tax=Synechococcus sp. BO 8801 TaxID=169670 RepID=UPI00117F2C88|nr:diadenylate cyclase [Synechococcus sp. BO 8801]
MSVELSLLEMVPQWYVSKIPSLNRRAIGSSQNCIFFHSKRAPTPALSRHLDYVNNNFQKLASRAGSTKSIHDISTIQQIVAINYLDDIYPGVEWASIVDYLCNAALRTYENSQINKNLLIDTTAIGIHSLFSDSFQKIVDPIGCAMNTVIRVDRWGNFVDIEQVGWDQINVTSEYKFYPEFLSPVYSKTSPSAISAVLTRQGDIIIGSESIAVTRRQYKWRLYDAPTLKNCIFDLYPFPDSYRIACNIYAHLFELSYKRHGALLIADPNSRVIRKVVNKHAIIDFDVQAPSNDLRRVIGEKIWDLGLGISNYKSRKSWIVNEVASMDGALIFNGKNITAYGAMIELHPDLGNQFGARTSAAISALKWGGYPTKISSDGEVRIYFLENGEVNFYSIL